MAKPALYSPVCRFLFDCVLLPFKNAGNPFKNVYRSGKVESVESTPESNMGQITACCFQGEEVRMCGSEKRRASAC